MLFIFEILSGSDLNGTSLNTGRFFFVSILTHLVFTLQFVVLIYAFSNVHFPEALMAVFFIFFVKNFFPISIGDLGIREAVSIYTLAAVGVSQPAAFNSSLLIFFVNIFIPALAGAFFIVKYKKQ
ncbi:hypothetical protein ACFL4T_11995 [candidate division KSB1 bacterium]